MWRLVSLTLATAALLVLALQLYHRARYRAIPPAPIHLTEWVVRSNTTLVWFSDPAPEHTNFYREYLSGGPPHLAYTPTRLDTPERIAAFGDYKRLRLEYLRTNAEAGIPVMAWKYYHEWLQLTVQPPKTFTEMTNIIGQHFRLLRHAAVDCGAIGVVPEYIPFITDTNNPQNFDAATALRLARRAVDKTNGRWEPALRALARAYRAAGDTKNAAKYEAQAAAPF